MAASKEVKNSAKPAVAKVEAAKAEVAKTETAKVAEKKVEEVKPVAEKKTAAKKTTTTKKVAAKTTAKKETKEIVESHVFVQTGYSEIVADDVIAKIMNAYKEEGNTTKVKNVNVYIKPNENAAYYVINDKIAGMVQIF